MSPDSGGGADLVPEPSPGPGWTRRISLEDLDATAALGRRLAGDLRAGDLLILTGGLGAGKTTFTQALAEGLEVEGLISSPTFVLSRVHRGEHLDLVHVDAYRTDAVGFEDLDIGASMGESVTVVEWGRRIAEAPLVGDDGSWLDLELVDPALSGTGLTGTESDAPAIITDFSEAEEDVVGSVRHAVLRGYGPRWTPPPPEMGL